MTVQEAYYFTLQQASSLSSHGYSVEIKPSTTLDAEGQIDKSLYVNVTIESKRGVNFNKVNKVRKKLIERGIIFDSGGDQGSRKWCLDHSFDYNHEAVLNVVPNAMSHALAKHVGASLSLTVAGKAPGTSIELINEAGNWFRDIAGQLSYEDNEFLNNSLEVAGRLSDSNLDDIGNIIDNAGE